MSERPDQPMTPVGYAMWREQHPDALTFGVLPVTWSINDNGLIVKLPPSNPHRPISNAKWHPPRPRA